MSGAWIKFCLVGGLVCGVDFAVLWLGQLFLPRLAAVSVAYFVAVSFHFALNKWWVFRAEEKVRATELVRYVFTVIVCWLCTVGVVWVATGWLTSSIFVAKLMAIPPATLLSFLLMRKFVFRRDSAGGA
jgi:putative flippase GtrA